MGWKVPITTGKYQLNARRTDTLFQTQETMVSSFRSHTHTHTRDEKLKQFSRRRVKHFFRNEQLLQQDADHTFETQRAFEHTKKL